VLNFKKLGENSKRRIVFKPKIPNLHKIQKKSIFLALGVDRDFGFSQGPSYLLILLI
jgi:hypothetical protein